jgi:hypothetical protein
VPLGIGLHGQGDGLPDRQHLLEPAQARQQFRLRPYPRPRGRADRPTILNPRKTRHDGEPIHSRFRVRLPAGVVYLSCQCFIRIARHLEGFFTYEGDYLELTEDGLADPPGGRS